MDLLVWLQTLTEYPKIYWKDRFQETAIAGAGFGFSPLSYSWQFFNPTKVSHWADFSACSHFSPRLIQESKDQSSLKWKLKNPLRQTQTPTSDEWKKLVEKALFQIENKEFEKCVLAREQLLHFEKPLDPWPLVAELERNISNAYVICIQPTERSAFISATPEKLFSRKNELLETESLASTRKAGSHKTFSSPKNQKEFLLVEDSIRNALLPLSSEELIFSPQSIRATSGLEHLYSQLQVSLKKNISDQEILDRMHPTAALLGYPKDKTLTFLKKHEPFARGLYGAPIGQLTPDGSTWIVGIRSCLLFESTARLYSGAGIVAGSDPTAEWEELDQKLSSFAKIFSLSGRSF